MKGVMIQGTSSDVGKSLIATALCRILANKGIKVAPFKSQNMSNNSYVTMDGKEIGRAQGIQAEAAKVEATVWMNPILLKPRSDSQSEVVLLGEATTTLSGRDYREQFYQKGIRVIQKSLEYLHSHNEMVIMEGAGSPVEINLKDRELVNMKVAELADIPVILVADIDRGGVFASIIGTLALFSEQERRRVKGIIINKFRGDQSLFEDGVRWLEEKTGIPVLGVLPFIHDHMIEGEDSLSIREKRLANTEEIIDLAVVNNRYLSNFTDIEPFFFEQDVSVRLVHKGEDLGNPDAVILPGTKSTIADLEAMKRSGLADQIKNYYAKGGRVIGLCGGYQMLCTVLKDPHGTDTGIINEEIEGIGLIPATTTFEKKKQTIRVEGTYHPYTELACEKVEGYEIHLGKTEYISKERCPFLWLDSREEGYYRENGRLIGTYMHHLFYNDVFRNTWLDQIRLQKGLPKRKPLVMQEQKDKRFDVLADEIKKHLDWEKVMDILQAGD
ncbi:cobyric acid synthase [Niallia circulans]|uniref:Cobyric acid synthase n=1 Tax=Niallia circulans TaxID=1397 RepID=A0A941GHV9_NIACI|nr:cobyric acid synthase [Niallia circulans]EOR26150.1 cobyric acid synthase [Niallia nealsonii AAU1]MCB5238188.1 cobyric acid synthase [Niallia circulans]